MPTPAPRTPICIARGNLADLQASLGDIQDGEICYATDENAHYQKEGVTLKKVDGAVPTVGDGRITLKQGGQTKGTFTVNQAGNQEINLDAGGSGGGSDYTLPAATNATLGGIKVGSGLSVTGDGTLSASSGGFSGDYNDLTNKPSIGAGVVTIKQGGTTKGSFNVNQTSASEIDLDAGGGGSYTLPPATAGALGGIKVGSGLSVTGDGTLSADGSGGGGYTLPPATSLVLGGIKVGGGLNITGDGTLSAVGDGSGIGEAPTDGKQYGRQNSGWTEIVSSGGGGGDTLPDGNATGDLLQWNGSAWVPSNVIDGGTY